MKQIFKIFWCAAIVLFAAESAHSGIIRLPLKDMLPVKNVLLQGVKNDTNRYNYNISIPERWNVRHAMLTFSYSCSTALIKERSRLVFSLGDTPLHQVTLDPMSPKGTVTAQIPGKLLKPGYHPLRFTVIQHYAEDGCEDPSAPELWTWVELSEAYISLDISLKPVPERVSAISKFLFDPRNLAPEPINLVFPKVDKNSMRPVALCASGTALRYDYRPISLFAKKLGTVNMDTIMVGPEDFIREQLEQFSDVDLDWTVPGPFLEVRHLPEKKRIEESEDLTFKDVYHPLIIVTGKTWDEVAIAAKAYSMLTLPLPDTPTTRVDDVAVPELTIKTHENTLISGKEYSLASLGFATHTFHGFYPLSNGFSFRIPTDSFLSPNDNVVLSLNIAYGAAMRADSVLNILLNDTFVAAIPCNDKNGGDYRNYEVRLLTSSLNPGYNTITFAPQLTPLITDKCTMIQDGNLNLTIMGDSTLTLPKLDSWIEMPNIKAFMDDAFPYGTYANMQGVSISIPDKSRTSFMTAVNLVSALSQKTGFPPLAAKWYLDTETLPASDIICVSKTESLPAVFVENSPIQFKNQGVISSLHLSHPKGEEPGRNKNFWTTLFPDDGSKIIDLSLTASELVVTKMAPVVMRDKAALLQFESPLHKEKTVTLVTTQSDRDMQRTAKMLWDNAFRSACKGDTTLVNLSTKPYDVVSMELGPKYHLGAITPVPFVEKYTNTYPIRFIILIAGLCFLLALFVFWALRRLTRNKGV